MIKNKMYVQRYQIDKMGELQKEVKWKKNKMQSINQSKAVLYESGLVKSLLLIQFVS